MRVGLGSDRLVFIGRERITGLVRCEHQLLEFSQRRKILEVGQPEDLQEALGGRVEHRAARHLSVASQLDELALEQASHHGSRVHAADVLHLCARQGLPIRDDRQGLEGGVGKTQRPSVPKLLKIRSVRRVGTHLVATGDLANLERALLGDVLGI